MKKESVLTKGPGEHIVVDTSPKNNTYANGFIVKLETKSKQADTFLKKMKPKEVKDAIEIAVKHGEVPRPKEDIAKISYSGEKINKYGIEKLVVIRDPVTGHIITAYPKG